MDDPTGTDDSKNCFNGVDNLVWAGAPVHFARITYQHESTFSPRVYSLVATFSTESSARTSVGYWLETMKKCHSVEVTDRGATYDLQVNTSDGSARLDADQVGAVEASGSVTTSKGHFDYDANVVVARNGNQVALIQVRQFGMTDSGGDPGVLANSLIEVSLNHIVAEAAGLSSYLVRPPMDRFPIRD